MANSSGRSTKSGESLRLPVLSPPFAAIQPVETTNGQQLQIVVEEQPTRKKKDTSLCARVCRSAIFVLGIVVSVWITVYGTLFLKTCPLEPLLPIWNIITGLIFICIHTLNTLEWMTRKQVVARGRGSKPNSREVVKLVLLGVLTMWSIIGCMWVYAAYAWDYNCNANVFTDKLNSAIFVGVSAVVGPFGLFLQLHTLYCRRDRK